MAIIKGLNFGQKLAVGLGIFIYRLWIATLRVEIDAGLRALMEGHKGGLIILVWHNRLALALAVKNGHNKNKQLAGLVSASRDGAILSEIMNTFGITPIRGSSSRRAMEATREVVSALENGCAVIITPDGPRGPVYTLKEGLAGLTARYPIATVGLTCTRFSQLNSWDKFILPAPFSTVRTSWKLHSAGTPTEDLRASLMEQNQVS